MTLSYCWAQEGQTDRSIRASISAGWTKFSVLNMPHATNTMLLFGLLFNNYNLFFSHS